MESTGCAETGYCKWKLSCGRMQNVCDRPKYSGGLYSGQWCLCEARMGKSPTNRAGLVLGIQQDHWRYVPAKACNGSSDSRRMVNHEDDCSGTANRTTKAPAMKLIELEPRWINATILAFLCPCCRKVFLTARIEPMDRKSQHAAYEKEFGENWNMLVVPSKPDAKWTITGNVTNMTVTPSIDASASGHWHGHIVNGECMP